MTAVRRGDPAPEAIEVLINVARTDGIGEAARIVGLDMATALDVIDRFASACAACGDNIMPFCERKLSGTVTRWRCMGCGRER